MKRFANLIWNPDSLSPWAGFLVLLGAGGIVVSHLDGKNIWSAVIWIPWIIHHLVGFVLYIKVNPHFFRDWRRKRKAAGPREKCELYIAPHVAPNDVMHGPAGVFGAQANSFALPKKRESKD